MSVTFANDGLPTWVARDAGATLSLQAYVDGVLTAPSSATVTVRDALGQVVAAGAATPGTTSTYALQASALAGRLFGPGYSAEWSLTGAVAGVARQSLVLCRVPPQQTLTLSAFQGLYPDFWPPARRTSPSEADKDRAWSMLLQRLIVERVDASRILNTDVLQSAHAAEFARWLYSQAQSGPQGESAERAMLRADAEVRRRLTTQPLYLEDPALPGAVDQRKTASAGGIWASSPRDKWRGYPWR